MSLSQLLRTGLVVLAASIPSGVVQAQDSAATEKTTTELTQLLTPKLESTIADRASKLGDSVTIGVTVIDPRTRKAIFEHNADQAFSAASNAKVVTAAAALALLGSEFRFRTELLAETVDSKGRIPGNIYFRGFGNPLFGIEDMAQLVKSLKAAGVQRVDGTIVVDNSYFDSNNLPPHFDEQPDEHAAFRAPIAATSFAFNAWSLSVRPALAGAGPARIKVTPANDYVQVRSTVSTITTGRTHIRMKTVNEDKHVVVHLSGQVRKEVRQRRFRKRADNPLLFVGTSLRRALAEQGIIVRGKKTLAGKTPVTALRQALHESAPLGVAIRGMGKYSNNFVAELLLKVLGAEVVAKGQPATWQHGIEAVETFLTSAGLAKGSYRYENGSGLFDSNRFTPNQIARVLMAAQHDFRWGPDFLASLSIAGTDGTLSRRMLGTAAERQLRAKTGTLDGVSALSGVAAIDSQAPLLFSILINGFPESSIGIARALQNEIGDHIVETLRQPSKAGALPQ